MLLEVSISARMPERVADFLQLLIGKADIAKFAPCPGALTVRGRDSANTIFTVFPINREVSPQESGDAIYKINAAPRAFSATTLTLTTPTADQQIISFCRRENWRNRWRTRDGWDELEVWVEDRLLFCILTAAEAARRAEHLGR